MASVQFMMVGLASRLDAEFDAPALVDALLALPPGLAPGPHPPAVITPDVGPPEPPAA
jgi:hypothetical protein